MYRRRSYRHWVKTDELVSFHVMVKESDLLIMATRNLKSEARRALSECRRPLEQYMLKHVDFAESMKPVLVKENAPEIVRRMSEAAHLARVGPMAAVAGAVAEMVGKALQKYSSEVVVENGGDIYIKSKKIRKVGIYAGDSSFTGKIAIEIDPTDTPLGVCTSSGTVGHSKSLGKADAAIVIARSASLADAAATALGNRVNKAEDISRAIEFIRGVKGITAALVTKNDKIGIWGKVKLCPIGKNG